MPPVYWARTTASGGGGSTACRTFTFSSRTSSAENVTGGSMQSRLSSWSMWFCTRSRSAPEES